MLTRKDVALIRAALKFFSEEMSPFDRQLLKHYFDRPSDANIKQSDVDRLRALMKDCELRYLACDRAGTTVLELQLRRDAKSALASAKARQQRLAAVLLFKIPNEPRKKSLT